MIGVLGAPELPFNSIHKFQQSNPFQSCFPKSFFIAALGFPFQEEVDAKLAKADEDSDSSSSSSSDSDSSSSSSVLGLPSKANKGKKKKAAATATKGEAKKAAPKASSSKPTEKPDKTEKSEGLGASGPVESAGDGQATAPSVSASSAKDKQSLPALLEKANQALTSLQQINATAIWSQALKPKDIESRLQKACDLTSKLQSRTADAVALETGTQIEAEVNRVSQENDALRALQQDPVLAMDEHKDQLQTIVNNLTDDSRLIILTDICKKLVEAGNGLMAIFHIQIFHIQI